MRRGPRKIGAVTEIAQVWITQREIDKGSWPSSRNDWWSRRSVPSGRHRAWSCCCMQDCYNVHQIINLWFAGEDEWQGTLQWKVDDNLHVSSLDVRHFGAWIGVIMLVPWVEAVLSNMNVKRSGFASLSKATLNWKFEVRSSKLISSHIYPSRTASGPKGLSTKYWLWTEPCKSLI